MYRKIQRQHCGVQLPQHVEDERVDGGTLPACAIVSLTHRMELTMHVPQTLVVVDDLVVG